MTLAGQMVTVDGFGWRHAFARNASRNLTGDLPMELKRRRKLMAHYRIESGKGFHLKDHDPGDIAGIDADKGAAAALLAEGVDRLSTLQDKLYAQDRWGVLCIFQAMDAAGKDGAIKHVFSGINAQGSNVTSFKAPGPVELDHDFLWRHIVALPARGALVRDPGGQQVVHPADGIRSPGPRARGTRPALPGSLHPGPPGP